MYVCSGSMYKYTHIWYACPYINYYLHVAYMHMYCIQASAMHPGDSTHSFLVAQHNDHDVHAMLMYYT